VGDAAVRENVSRTSLAPHGIVVALSIVEEVGLPTYFVHRREAFVISEGSSQNRTRADDLDEPD
jgi:hypothetical protein